MSVPAVAGRRGQQVAGRVEHVDLVRVEMQRHRRAERELVDAGELGDELADRRVDVQEGVGARDLGQLDLARQRDVAGARRDAQRAGADADGERRRARRRQRQRMSSTPPRRATPAALASPAIRFIGGSLKARATRIDFGRWKTSAVGPYWSSSPASSTAV